MDGSRGGAQFIVEFVLIRGFSVASQSGEVDAGIDVLAGRLISGKGLNTGGTVNDVVSNTGGSDFPAGIFDIHPEGIGTGFGGFESDGTAA